MSCSEWHEAIALFVDGESTVEGLAQHLERCGCCRQLFRDLHADQAELRRVPDIDPAVFAALRLEVLGVARRTTLWGWRILTIPFLPSVSSAPVLRSAFEF